MLSNHSAGGLCGQLSHHVPHQLHPRYGSVDPGIADRVSPHLQQLRLHGLQAASDQQEGLLHGAWQLNKSSILIPSPALWNVTVTHYEWIDGRFCAFCHHRFLFCLFCPFWVYLSIFTSWFSLAETRGYVSLCGWLWVSASPNNYQQPWPIINI